MKRLLFRLALVMVIAFGQSAAFAAVAPEASSTTQNKAIPFKKEDTSAGEAAGRSFAVLAVLLGLVFAGAVAVRRYLPQMKFELPLSLKAGQKRRLKLVETMRLGPRTSLYLVQLDGRELLLAQSGDTVTHIIYDQPAGSGSAQKAENHV